MNVNGVLIIYYTKQGQSSTCMLRSECKTLIVKEKLIVFLIFRRAFFSSILYNALQYTAASQ